MATDSHQPPLTLLASLLLQEQDLQFLTFDSELALELGHLLFQNAKVKGLSVVISITLNNHLLFHYAMTGTTPADAEAVRRKNALVNQFSHSSYYVGQYLKHHGKTFDDFIEGALEGPGKESLGYGGAFPLLIKGVGVVGTISASGLAGHIDDHELVVSSLKEFLGMEKEGKNKVE